MAKVINLSHAQQRLRSVGFTDVIRAKYNTPSKNRSPILIVNGLRVAVKISNPSPSGKWSVNFHCHGKLDEKRIDAYLIVLTDIPSSTFPLYLVLPAPQGVTGLLFSFSSLVKKWRDNIEAWGLLKDLIESKETAA